MSYYDIIFVVLFLATVLRAVVLYYGHNLCWWIVCVMGTTH